MAQNIPLPQMDTARIESLLVGAANPGLPPDQSNGTGVRWVRLAALVLGLAGFFGGVGTTIGLLLVSDSEISGLWSLGLIPTSIGMGLLIFVRLSRGLAEKMEGA